MKPGLIKIRGLRGYQDTREIPLSPKLTVIYGGNSRGKTSLCEGWDWLITGELLSDRDPQAELGDARENIHVEEDSLFELYDLDGDLLARRNEDGLENPGGIPEEVSPVMLQYNLQRILYTQLRNRRVFFEDILDVTVESTFASNLRSACRNLSPFDLDVWKKWQQSAGALAEEEFIPPHSAPETSDQQQENEAALLSYLSTYFDCDEGLEALQLALESPDDTHEPEIENASSPIDGPIQDEVEATLEQIEDIEHEAERALERAVWREEGIPFAEPPTCPFCREDTIEDRTLEEIDQEADDVRERHRAHREATRTLQQALQTVTPLVEVNVDQTQAAIQELLDTLGSLGLDPEGTHADRLNRVSDELEKLQEAEYGLEALEDPEVFEESASVLLDVSAAWMNLQPTLNRIRQELRARQTRSRHMRSAQNFLEYSEEDTSRLYRLLDAQEILEEVAEASPATVNDLKSARLEDLADDIIDFYRELRPDDPTPLEDIETAGAVRGDIKVWARSRDEVEHASKLFGYSNANALGMAAHIARAVREGHGTIVLDDPLQSLDSDNRENVIQNLVERLLDDGLQVVILTHDRAAARRLLDRYVERDVRGISLGWDEEEGPQPRPMYPNADRQLARALDVFERDDPTEIQKATSALRELLEHFCHSYLRAVGGEIPPAHRRNLGAYIDKLRALGGDVRPTSERMQDLDQWNQTLSVEAHLGGEDAPGMDRLKQIAREMLDAQGQERQLRPPDIENWGRVPSSGGIAQRVSRILQSNG